MFSELVSDFIEAGRNFIFTFLHKKGQPKFVKPSALIKKYLFDFQDPQNKYSSRDTIPWTVEERSFLKNPQQMIMTSVIGGFR